MLVSSRLVSWLKSVLKSVYKLYRCWVVWHRAFIFILPSFLLWLATGAMAIWIIYLESTLNTNVLITAKQLKPAGITFWALSITLNIITTGKSIKYLLDEHLFLTFLIRPARLSDIQGRKRVQTNPCHEWQRSSEQPLTSHALHDRIWSIVYVDKHSDVQHCCDKQ